MEPMTVRELLTATGGRLLGEEAVAERTITGVETDSRAVHEGDLFVALRGERTDGHRYIASALETGAAGCLTEGGPPSAAAWKVLYPGGRTPCWPLARWPGRIERSFHPVIGITGSVGQNHHQGHGGLGIGAEVPGFENGGKLQQRAGSPLTLFRHAQHQICVLEMGMNHFREIDYLTQIAP